MLAIGVRYLCGRVSSSEIGNRSIPEWPPHPDRLFLALCATFFETGMAQDEREALEWLEGQSPPSMKFSKSYPRTTVTAFVPANDMIIKKSKKESNSLKELADLGLSLHPDYRFSIKHQKIMAATIPIDEDVYFQWDLEPEQKIADALDRLCKKMIYLGNSSSLVQTWVQRTPVDVTHAPVSSSKGGLRLRVPTKGGLASLAVPPNRPKPRMWSTYAPIKTPEVVVGSSCFNDQLLILKQDGGTRLGIESCQRLTETLRATLMSISKEQPPSSLLSGHNPDGSPLQTPHFASFPLVNVGNEYADGSVMGLALAIPRGAPQGEIDRILGGTVFDEYGDGIPIRLVMGTMGEVTLIATDSSTSYRKALDPNTWTRASDIWETVTPIVLDRFPKRINELDIAARVAEACENSLLPRPIEISCSNYSRIAGAPPARAFGQLQSGKSTTGRFMTHASIRFSEPIQGPILIGAGRYKGYGLCLPKAIEDMGE